MGNLISQHILQFRKQNDSIPFNSEILDQEPPIDLADQENYMTSIVYQDHQSIESLVFDRYTAFPRVMRGEVLIKVSAFGVNRIDIKLIENNISTKILPLPKTFGCEFSGRVISTTACYTDYLTVGDHVVGMIPLFWTKKGTAAEFISVNENLCAKVPSTISVIDVAAIPLVGLTVLQALREFLQENQPVPEKTIGKRILIQDASSGIGAFAIQYCKNVLGMYVIATCAQRDLSFVQTLGADEIIDHQAR
jgi:NADPH:quinone reductase-like Zn-dependent oxidoreductase